MCKDVVDAVDDQTLCMYLNLKVYHHWQKNIYAKLYTVVNLN